MWVNLYIGSETSIDSSQGKITISQTTDYPWEGMVKIAVTPDTGDQEFTLRLRLPGWCKSHSLTINDKNYTVEPRQQYLDITRRWNAGDTVRFTMDMPVEIVAADPRVKADTGKRHIERGPLVYCIEETDNPEYDRISLSPSTQFTLTTAEGLTDDIRAIKADNGNTSYTLVPYYSWDNRASGRMKVWLDYVP